MPILEANSVVERKQQFLVVGELCTYIILMQLEMTKGNEPNQHKWSNIGVLFYSILLAAFRHVKQLKDFVIFIQNNKFCSKDGCLF